jgi:hypothetical protein
MKFEWHEGSLVAPPTQWFHQHFNTGAQPARYLAIRRGGRLGSGENANGAAVSVTKGGWQIEYQDEDPKIHQDFEGLVAQSRMSCRMEALHPLCSRKTSAA